MAKSAITDSIKKIVSEGLQKTRCDLLDLTGRNKLLNFKHSGAKILRIVDELPNHIYSELLTNAENDSKSGFILSPVPLPKKGDYPDIEDKKDFLKIDVRTHAKNLGISTDFEMQATNKSGKSAHYDDKLQTLLYPEDLDRLARRIQSEARTAIEESGVNMLFLCLGFLKWSDSNNSEVFNHAPLIMIPVAIEREKIDAKTGYARFRLRYTGEDIFDNICLREKLSQFSIELPSFDIFETPEEYFSALEKILVDIKPDWSIQRFITLSFLSFGKMLMYLDLDPNRWPEIDGIADSEHIVDIFSGNHSGDGSVAPDFDIDNDKALPKLPHVMDADSSQHSAIIDVLKGKNVVIEGPPGTGKSQTITNLIAACLAEGKTVLFVAEKLAALEVVRKRLDSVNLGNFCLELHSHKTQKKALMSDLKKRLDMNTNSYKTADMMAEMRISELNKKKTQLIQYTKAVNTSFGKTQETPHEIFWKTEKLYNELSQAYKVNVFNAPKNVTETTISELREHLELVKNLSDNLRDYYGAENKTQNHYWHGLSIKADYSLQQDIFNGLLKLANIAKDANIAYNQISPLGFDNFLFNEFSALLTSLDEFTASDFDKAALYELFNLEEIVPLVKEGIELLQAYTEHLENYLKVLSSYNIEAEQIKQLNQSTTISNIKLPEQLSFQELSDSKEKIASAIALFEKTNALFKEAAGYLNLGEEVNTVEALGAIIHGTEICSSLDKAILSYRNPVIENAMGNPALQDITEKVLSLRQTQAELSEHIEVDKALPVERLKEIQGIFKNKKMLSVLSSQWRLAVSDYRKFSKIKKEKDYNAAAARIESLINYCTGVSELAQNSTYKTLLPNFYQGIDTDIGSLKSAISFYEELRSNTLKYPTYGTRLYNNLKTQDPVIYDWFSEQKDSLVKGLDALNSIKSYLGITPTDNIFDANIILNNAKAFIIEYERVKPLLDKAKIPNVLNLGKLKESIQATADYEATKQSFNNNSTIKKLSFSDKLENLDGQLRLLQGLLTTANKAHKLLPATILPKILCSDGYENLQNLRNQIECICNYLNSLDELQNTIPNLNGLKDFWRVTAIDGKVLLHAIATKLETIENERESFDKWCGITNSYADLKSVGIYGVVDSFESATTVSFLDYAPLYAYLFYHALSDEALRQNKILGSFSRITHENIRDSFKSIDIELQKLNSQALAHQIKRRELPKGMSGRSVKEYTDMVLINNEITKQKAHIPIRQLVARAYDALVAMKPCFMMGPLSVAQYLAPGHEKFDVLIMDEASQVKPEDAIGVLARAKQVVIVGDSNQLPPTGFFDSLGDGDNDNEETTITNSESILDVCRPLFQPIRRLRWHYRSQHQSLISFSNHHFYENDLVIFPSPTAHSETIGVKHVYVSDGVYMNQSNPIEAQRLVQDIMQMVERHPERSYGIVTLNAKQKMVIEDELERARKESPLFDRYLSETENSDEGLFVKNLENVQGDERDVIYISTTFGPDEAGAFRQSFGPINGKDGWRRLNVLYTRAKQHIRIFSSFHGERIKVDDTREQRGLRALKDYLQFAATGVDNHSYQTKKDPDSDFERAVGAFLRSKGYNVVYQLGVAGYLIDMVVQHPQYSNDYVIAIECDGATYHSAKSSRDRDRLRESNLRKLGWNHIHRIWSTDWFKTRKQEEERLLKAVETAIADYDLALSKSGKLSSSKVKHG